VPTNGQYRSELVGTEGLCQLTVISAIQYRAFVLLAYVEGLWFPLVGTELTCLNKVVY